MELTHENLDRAASRILAVSRDLYPELVKAAEPQPGYSERAMKYDRYIAGAGFGCHEKAVRGLVQLVIGEDLPPIKAAPESGQWTKCYYTVLFCEKDGVAAIWLPGEVSLDQNGNSHGSAWRFDKGATRLPTLDEVKAVLWSNRDHERMKTLRSLYLFGLE